MKGKSMKGLCKTIGYCILVLGIIGSIYLAYTLGEVSGTSSYYGIYRSYTYRDWVTTIVCFVSGVFSSGVFSVIFFALSEILERLERSTYSGTTMNFSSPAPTPYSVPNNEDILSKGGWRCERCGNVNPNFYSNCACGAGRNS